MTETVTTRCCIAGGGPAGMMLGLLLARAGVPVVVLEKHTDFLRDFRGDTVHPSTLNLMDELGLLDDFLRRPHNRVTTLTGQIGPERVTIADFRHVPTRCKFVALMPQWDFLDFIADTARRYPSFDLRMQAEAVALMEDNGKVTGVRANMPDGDLAIHADLVIGADGRHSTLRQAAALAVDDIGAPMDVLWFRLSRHADDPEETFGHLESGRMMVMLNRGDYWQCAYVIAKGSIDQLKAKGLPAFRDTVAAMSPFVGDRLHEISDWDHVKLLTVAVDRLRRWWRPGLLCIGDAAHAMSPIGGVGINLAIQDAVAAANRLAQPLYDRRVTDADLAAVEQRRTFPTRATQRVQVAIQNSVISSVLSGNTMRVPFVVRLLQWIPLLRVIPAYVVGVGVRPEHIETPERL
ncbi:MAG: FAD-dependent oxidoreductase [Pseudolabrys sp.]|nr:FAD-dependent oxidoreductase [Pseudolabrys sp.]